jgi:hypothetical protein
MEGNFREFGEAPKLIIDGQVTNHHHHNWLDSPTWALAFLRSFCQLKYPAIASSDFATRVYSRVGLSAPRPKLQISYTKYDTRVLQLHKLTS